MSYLNKNQLPAFILIMLAGVSSALVYEIGTLLLRTKSFFLRCIFDLFLSAATVFVLFIAVYESGESNLRFYMLCAFVIGSGVCSFVIHKVLENTLYHLSEKRKSAENSE